MAPLGYAVEDRKLVIDEAEADTVRHIYRRYVALGSVRELKIELDRSGIVSKRRVDRFGCATEGRPLTRGALYHMLGTRMPTRRTGRMSGVERAMSFKLRKWRCSTASRSLERVPPINSVRRRNLGLSG